MAALVAPLPEEVCPMPAMIRQQYESPGPLLGEAVDPLLLEHRDRIYREFMEYPIEL